MPATTEHCIMCWVCAGYDVVGVMSLCRSLCVCVCVLSHCNSQSSSISHQSVAHRHGKPYSLSSSSLWQTNRSYRRQAEEPRVFDMTFFLVSPPSIFLCLSFLLSVVAALHFSSSISSYKLQVASCHLPVANQSVRQPDCTTDTSVRPSLTQLHRRSPAK